MTAVSVASIDDLDCRPPRFYGDDAVLRSPLHASLVVDGMTVNIEAPAGWTFQPGVKKMPWVARAFIRLNMLSMLRSSAIHDLLYDTQGGRRAPLSGVGTPLTRKQCDAIAAAILKVDGLGSISVWCVSTALRLFGKDAWDD